MILEVLDAILCYVLPCVVVVSFRIFLHLFTICLLIYLSTSVFTKNFSEKSLITNISFAFQGMFTVCVPRKSQLIKYRYKTTKEISECV